MMQFEFAKEDWFGFLEPTQQELVVQAETLYERELRERQAAFHDYSFVVFPMAKAYEGFLKKFFLTLGLIGQAEYEGDYLRIGKSLNPDLPERFRDHEWVVEELDRICGPAGETFTGQKLSKVLWQRWKRSRNLLFHYFPKNENFIGLQEAGERLRSIGEAIGTAITCQRNQGL
jgi:hypothetical protein